MKNKFLAGTVLALGALLSACAGGVYYTAYAPPAPRYAVVGAVPGPGYIWTSGYWNWYGGRWGWVEGRWQRPPRRNAVWVASEWRHEGHGYKYHRGHWR